MAGFCVCTRPAGGGIDNLRVVEGFAISELLDNQAVTDMPWLPSLIAPLVWGARARCKFLVNGECHALADCGGIFVRAVAKNGRNGIDEVLKMLECFSQKKS